MIENVIELLLVLLGSYSCVKLITFLSGFDRLFGPFASIFEVLLTFALVYVYFRWRGKGA